MYSPVVEISEGVWGAHSGFTWRHQLYCDNRKEHPERQKGEETGEMGQEEGSKKGKVERRIQNKMGGNTDGFKKEVQNLLHWL